MGVIHPTSTFAFSLKLGQLFSARFFFVNLPQYVVTYFYT